MPSPFPGMDPYLEGSEWTSVHTVLAVEIARQLTPRLLPHYIARAEKRYVVTTLDPMEDVGISSIYPDASIAEQSHVLRAGPATATGAVAPLTMATVVPKRIAQVWVEIRDAANRQLVTAIEILSPTNKQVEGRAEYLECRKRLLLSAAHLIEIDLLRRGQRLPMQQPLPSVPYFVFVGRADRRPLTDVWPITLTQTLPSIGVPLLAGDADVPLNLQAALSAVYDDGAYAASIDYSRPPEIPLSDDDRAWAQQVVARVR